MSLTTPVNPHNNTSPVILDDKNYRDPFELLAEMQAKEGLPDEVLDRVVTDCAALVKDSWLAFLDMFQMNIGFETDYVQFVEHETPDYVIDDDGAVTRAANVFTIVPAEIEGWESGQDYFFFRVDDTIAVYDNTGLKEMGVITAIDKANDQFTAVSRDGAAWSVATTNLTLDVTGSDFARASCGPDGLLELRKTKTHILKLQTIKEAKEWTGGRRYKFCLENGDVAWYDDNTLELNRRVNHKIAKSLMLETESVDGSGAHSAGRYGTQGLFAKLEADGILHTGYIETEAQLEAVTDYYDDLGIKDKEFVFHCDTQQYRYLEQIASEIANNLSIALSLVLDNKPDNMMMFGFKALMKDGYTIYFSKWELKNGNSPLGKNRVAEAMPKGILMPKGVVKTKINGEEKDVPYIFKAYQNMKMSPGMIRTFFTGAYAPTPTSDCEFLKVTKSTTVGIGVPCPEAILIVK
jgi:hypothetical protein